MPTWATPPADALVLQEAVQLLDESRINVPDAVRSRYSDEEWERMHPIIVIRPGLGKGKGRHLYEARMLQENAHKFSGWKMFVDHQSEEAKKKLGGLPRSMRDAGGVLKETWWDPSIPASPGRFDQGAVIGLTKPTRMVRELIEDVPEFVEASISTNATGVRPVKVGGRQAWLVEGIEDRGSVDWVTEAGAGGKVVALMESAWDEEDDDLLEGLSDDEFIAYLRDERPHLLEAVSTTTNPPEGGDDDMGELTPQALQEALNSDEFKPVLESFIQERIDERIEAFKTDTLPALVEAAIEEERVLIRAEARSDADRQIELRDMRDEAHKLIAESRLHPVLQDKVRAMFDLTEAGPTPALDLVEDVDDDGKTVKSARIKLREAVEQEVIAQRELLAAVSPTRVTGQGPSTSEGGEAKKSEGTYWGQVLQESGIDPDKAY